MISALSRIAVNSVATLFFGFFVLGALLIGIFVVGDIQSEYYGDIQQAVGAQNELRDVLDVVQDVEIGQRGFLLTGNKIFLEPYSKAAPAAGERPIFWGHALERTPGDLKAFAILRDLVSQKLAFAKATIVLQEAGRPDEARALVVSGKGRVLMERIRTTAASLLASQDVRIAKGFHLAERSAEWLRGGFLAAIFFVVGLAYLSFSRIREQLGFVTVSRDRLSEANRKLTIEVEQQTKLSAQLRQSQKMEALGQLTGGLAHDFNNMLAVIVSSISIIKRRMLRGETDIARYLDSAMDGAERAATLTRRLLAFARQQPLSPELIDPNKMVAGMAELLLRTLGEAVHLETVLAGGLWRVFADSSQLENAILNLALNARDAMPGGGRLTIETSNAHLNDEYADAHKHVRSGQYVLIAVTDTGVGMTPNLIERAFDPFFTTKPTGKGTGLGLSQFYGFVKQSGGHASIYSEPGHGTTFKFYLPRSYLSEAREIVPTQTEITPRGHASEIILVVEDDVRVCRLTVDALRELGYTVLHADGGAAALKQLEATPQVDLLFTDIVMPVMNGRELATEAERRYPQLRVLYTSGYVPNAVVHNATLSPLEDLISKPFTSEQLARKVRQVFNRPERKATVVPAQGSPAAV